MDPLQYYPWQQQLAQHWLGDRSRFAHAWLLYGITGIGKTQLAKAGAAALLCQQPNLGIACGQCASCQWVRSGNHPDLRLIRPESVQVDEDPNAEVAGGKNPSKHIRVEQLRELSTWFTTAPHRGGYKVAVVYPADRLNHVSANALLKILEEPPGQTVFILVTAHEDQLLPTIVSRCRRLALHAPSAEQSQAWLNQQNINNAHEWLAAVGGAPLAAWQQAQKAQAPYPEWLATLCQYLVAGQSKAIVQLAPLLENMPAAQWIDVLQRLYVDLQLLQQQQLPRYFPALQNTLQPLADAINPLLLQQQWKWLLTQKQVAEHPLNSKLVIHTTLERVAQTRA